MSIYDYFRNSLSTTDMTSIISLARFGTSFYLLQILFSLPLSVKRTTLYVYFLGHIFNFTLLV